MRKRTWAVVFIFLSGFMLMLAFMQYAVWSYEHEYVNTLADKIKSRCGDENITCMVDTALAYNIRLQTPANQLLSDKDFTTPQHWFTSTAFNNLYYGEGFCGAYADFFLLLMHKLGYRSKIILLEGKGRHNSHMAVGVEYRDKLLVTDPFFGFAYKNPQGALVDIHEVTRDWQYRYSRQVPAGYNPEFDYRYGWQYTNWQALGPLEKPVRHTGAFLLGKKAVDGFSSRYYRLRYGYVPFCFSVMLSIACMLWGWRRFKKVK